MRPAATSVATGCEPARTLILREQLAGYAPKVTNRGGEVKEIGYSRNVGSRVDPALLQRKNYRVHFYLESDIIYWCALEDTML